MSHSFQIKRCFSPQGLGMANVCLCVCLEVAV